LGSGEVEGAGENLTWAMIEWSWLFIRVAFGLFACCAALTFDNPVGSHTKAFQLAVEARIAGEKG